MNIQGKTILITGATGGIGESAARLLAKAGARVVLTARHEDELGRLVRDIAAAGGTALAVRADLTSAEERLKVLARACAAFGPVDVLVNNAGFGWYGFGSDMSWPVAEEMINLNVAAVTHLTLLVLKEMRSRRSGHIINVSSIAANLPSQGIALYCATKAFIDNFTASLYREMRGSGVHLSLLKPGPIKTAFFSRAAARDGSGLIPGGRFAAAPETVAKRVRDLIARPKKAAYTPKIFSLVPLVEILFSKIIDWCGPFLLKRQLRSPAVYPAVEKVGL